MAITIKHLETAVKELQQEKLSLDGSIALGVISVYVKQQSKQNKCDACDGTGTVEGESYDDLFPCHNCLGKGTIS